MNQNSNKLKNLYIALLVVIVVISAATGIMKYVFKISVKNHKTDASSSNEVKITEEFDTTKINNIELDADIADLVIKDGNVLSVAYDYDEDIKPKVEVKNDSLVITEKKRETINQDFDIDKVNCKLIITIPKDKTIDIMNLKVSLGGIKISDISADTFNLEANLGSVEVNKSKFETVDVAADLGSINIEDTDFTKAMIKDSLGSVYVDGEYDSLECYCSLGSIDVKTRKPENEVELNLKADLGSVSVNGVNR